MTGTWMLTGRGLARLAVTLLGAFLADQMYGQGLARISGRVTDPSGAVIPGATITATQAQTQFSRTAISSQDGYYAIPSLQPGPYELTVEATGFQRYVQEKLVLRVDEIATVNVALRLGAAVEAITVEAPISQVDLQTATLKEVVDERRINELPLDGRNAATLALLVGGVTPSPSDGADQGSTKTFPGAVTYSSNGSLQNQMNFRLDGADNMDFYTNVSQPFPFPDAVQEFSVQTSNYGAELGNQAGGAVNVVTRSGSNEFHGNLFSYTRNEIFNARNFFTPARDELKRNQFGGTVGGPIVKNRAFFFFGVQDTELRNTQSARTMTVPTAANLRGDFSALLDRNNPENPLGRVVQLVNPETRAPYPGNIVPASQFDPVALNMLKFIPEAGNTGGYGLVYLARPIRNDQKEFVVRADQSLSSKDRLTQRYNFADYDQASTYNGVSLLTLGEAAILRSQNLLVHETHIFTPNLINDVRVSYARVYSLRQRPKIPGATSADVGIKSDRFVPETGQTFGVDVQGFFSVSNFSELFINRNAYNFANDVKWISGRHNISFGGMIQKSRVDLGLPPSVPYMRFTNDQTGYAIASFMLGYPFFYSQASKQERLNEGWFPSLYIQDDFRATPRLSLSLGLRYDPYLTWGTPNDQVRLFSMSDYLAGNRSQVFTNAPPGLFYAGDPGFPEGGATGDHNNFAPRLGFAYDLTGSGKTSLRGGAGVFYDQRPPAITFNAFQGIHPWAAGFTFQPPSGRASDPLRGDEARIPTVVENPPRDVPFTRPVGVATLAAGQKSTSPVTYNWNLTIEHQLASGTLVRVSYVGSRANHIGVPVELNPAVYIPGSRLNVDDRRLLAPDYSSIRQTSQEVNSHYNGLQVGLDKRFGRGNGTFLDNFTLLANYTYARSMDTFPQGADPTGNTGGSDVSPLSFYDPGRRSFDYGPSRFDRRHVFVASYLWNLPELKNTNWIARNVLGGWQTTGILRIQSGLSLTPLAGQDRSQTGINQDRVQYLGGDPYGAGGCRPGEAPCVEFLNPSVFALPELGSAGNIGKGALRGPGFWNWDMGFLKNFQLTERMRLQVRAEFFNIFNTTNFIPSPGQTSFRYSAAGFGGIRESGDPRIGQLAAKFFF